MERAPGFLSQSLVEIQSASEVIEVTVIMVIWETDSQILRLPVGTLKAIEKESVGEIEQQN